MQVEPQSWIGAVPRCGSCGHEMVYRVVTKVREEDGRPVKFSARAVCPRCGSLKMKMIPLHQTSIEAWTGGEVAK